MKTKQTKTFRSAKLIQYKGGGYDGCFWEWNFGLIVDGKFHNIVSSGRNAIDNKADLLESAEYLYNLNRKKDLLEFTRESAEGMQGQVIGNVNEILGMDVMFYECTYCKDHVHFNASKHEDYPQYFHDPDNYRGNGGVGVNMGSIICEDCFCNTCEDCGSIFSPDDESFEVEDKRVCQYCHEKHEKESA